MTTYTLTPEANTTEVPIFPTFDERFEADEESFTVRIVGVSNGTIAPDRGEATVTIIDSDCKYSSHPCRHC